jgi:hypothetical protein
MADTLLGGEHIEEPAIVVDRTEAERFSELY